MTRRTILLLLLFAAPLRAADPRDTVERAVRAHGGDAALSRLKMFTQSAKGSVNFVGNQVPATRLGQFQLPDRVRWTIELALAPNRSVNTVLVVRGFRGWLKVTDQSTKEMTQTQLDDLTAESHVHWLCTILPLRDPSVSLQPGPENTWSGKPVRTLIATKGAKPATTLWFDRDTGLLIRATFRGPDAGRLVDKAMQFGGHKEYTGVTLPTLISEYKDGQRAAEWTVQKYEFVNGFEDATFAKP